MSDQNKHIDRIFQESFKNFEAQPSDAVWNKIQSQIQPKKKRILPFWLKSVGIAATLLLAFGLGYWLQPNLTNPQSSFTNLNDDDIKIEIQTNISTSFEKANQLLNQLIKQTAYVSNSTNPVETSIASNQTIIQSSTHHKVGIVSTDNNVVLTVAETISDESESQFNEHFSAVLKKNLLQDFNLNGSIIEKNKTASIEKQEEEKNQFDSLFEENEIVEANNNSTKWFLKPVLSPVFNSGKNASSVLGPEVASNSSSGDVSFSYGMQVGFKLSNSWSIRTGINQVNTSYTTENVVFAPAASAYMPAGTNSAYGLFSQDYYATSINTEGSRIFSQEGSLSQQMNFVEIPLEVEYALLAGKFGISLTGGASTLLLTDNGLLMNTADGKIHVGEAQNLNQTSFSTNVGLGLNYQLSKKLQFNVEPALRYQINTFQGSDLNFNPYFFGIYSGLQFQF